jgi:hypothetical protein
VTGHREWFGPKSYQAYVGWEFEALIESERPERKGSVGRHTSKHSENVVWKKMNRLWACGL